MFGYTDKIIFSPQDVDLDNSPVKQSIDEPTYVLGAFNPGMTRLPNGNILLMVRVAESLNQPIVDNTLRIIRKDGTQGYIVDEIPASNLNTKDPRKYQLEKYSPVKVYGLTSFSWILPVELAPDGNEVIKVHYDKILGPEQNFQEYGVEDARITKIGGKYYMTTCSVSSERHCTTLYSSNDGLRYDLEGIIMDHQNKDMVLFPRKIDGKYYAMTRPLGSLYFNTPQNSIYNPGPSINLAVSPDLLHWKPLDKPFIRAKKDSLISMKLGGGAPPFETDEGWLILFHGVEKQGSVGIYRTFGALLDKDNPQKIKYIDENQPILESKPKLVQDIKDKIYLKNVVFTSGVLEHNDSFIVASGELDLCCRLTYIKKDKIRDIYL